jgi:hypothetical protein
MTRSWSQPVVDIGPRDAATGIAIENNAHDFVFLLEPRRPLFLAAGTGDGCGEVTLEHQQNEHWQQSGA